MNKPTIKTYKDKSEIEEIFKQSIVYHSKMFDDLIQDFSANPLFHDWRLLIRSVDEIINIPLEIDDNSAFMAQQFELFDPAIIMQLKKLGGQLTKNFDSEVTKRFNTLAAMSMASHFAYQTQNLWETIGYGLGLSSSAQAISYYQSRRLALGGILNLIPLKAKGSKKTPYNDLLNQFLYTTDTCLVGYAGAYYHLLINECLNDYEVTFDGSKFISNFKYEHLEGFFLEPERLSLMDQLELRPGVVFPAKSIARPKGVIFSFNEVANAMALFEGAFNKYNITSLPEYQELNTLFMSVARFCTDHYNVVMDENELDDVQAKLKKLKLIPAGLSYETLINDYAPFQRFEGKCYSTVVLLTRFSYRTLSSALMRNRSFAINSGFIFEDRVAGILESAGYQLTGITRINKKEFDLITIKNGKVYNFQCKNNHIDIAKVNTDYQLMGRLNKRLISYYRKAITKEEKRENLISTKTGIGDITHFVISRYPVITRDLDILNFNTLEDWLKKQSH